MRKYEFTGKEKTLENGTVLRQIKAVRSFEIVKNGDIGGWIEKESNLSHDGNAWVYGDARVYGDAQVYGDARVYGDAQVYGDARVCGDARVYGDARVCGDARVYGNAQVYEDAKIYGDARVCESARIVNTDQYMIIGPVGSRNDFTTFFKGKDGISVKCGCFTGNIQAFLKDVKETHGDGKHSKTYQAAAMLAKAQIGD